MRRLICEKSISDRSQRGLIESINNRSVRHSQFPQCPKAIDSLQKLQHDDGHVVSEWLCLSMVIKLLN
jgi:hypothetical protein